MAKNEKRKRYVITSLSNICILCMKWFWRIISSTLFILILHFIHGEDSPSSDHIECDVTRLGLSEDQLKLVYEAYDDPRLQNNPQLLLDAAETHIHITPHLIYRYLASGEWTGSYNGRPIVDAVISTIQWRKEYAVHRIQPQDDDDIYELLSWKTIYVNGIDQNNRALLYFKIGNIKRKISPPNMIKTLMYSVERADRLSLEAKSGEFVVILDFAHVSFHTVPSFAVVKEALHLLKYNYPYRLHSIIVLNSGVIFTTLWTLAKPLLPLRAIKKTLVLSTKEAEKVLISMIGKDRLEKSYGGEVDEISDMNDYISSGYWDRVNRKTPPAGLSLEGDDEESGAGVAVLMGDEI